MLTKMITVFFLTLCTLACVAMFIAFPWIALIAAGIVGLTILTGFLAMHLWSDEKEPQLA